MEVNRASRQGARMSRSGKVTTVLLVTVAVLAGSWLAYRMIGRNGGMAQMRATPIAPANAPRVAGPRPVLGAKVIAELVPKKAPPKHVQPAHFPVKAPRD
jgi:hypothetical protein